MLLGQSNMAGRGELQPGEQIPHERVYMLDQRSNWVIAADPLHFDIHENGVGPGLSFGKTMAGISEKITIGLIPCAVGGTKLEQWIKGGNLFEYTICRFLSAAKSGCLKGLLWHQGESDCCIMEDANSYGERFELMIEDLRFYLGFPNVPFIAGELGKFIDKKRFPYSDIVNNKLFDAANRVSNYSCIHSDGLNHKNDYLHFDTKSMEELGRRYAKAMLLLQGYA